MLSAPLNKLHMILLRLAGLSLFAGLLFSCQPSATSHLPKDDHTWMVDTLATLAREADPMKNYSLNTGRAKVYADRAKEAENQFERQQARFQEAIEWLNSGQTSIAIEQLQKLLNEAGGEDYLANDQQKKAALQLAIAHIRLGEQQNCLLNHSPESCVMPFRGGGLHTLRDGSQRAIELLTKLLRTDFGNLEARYLLNIAHMTLGSWPDSVPAAYRLPASYAGEERPDFPEFEDIGMTTGTAINGLSGGVVIADFNGDQLLDIMASSYGLHDPLALLMAQPGGGFSNQMKQAGLEGITGGLQLVQADYDNDGDTDVLVLRGGWFGEGGKLPNSLLQNQGNGQFRDVTRSSGILSFYPTQTAAWADLNLDGWPDLVIGNEAGAPIELFVSQRNGTFVSAGEQAGLATASFVKGLTAGDYDRDGRIDLFCSVLGGDNLLYHNESDSSGIHFREVAKEAGVTQPRYAFPAWFWDFDQDGWLDIYSGSYDLTDLDHMTGELYAEAIGISVQAERPRLYRNLKNGTFEEVSAAAGLDKLSWAMGCSFGDLDNNGYPDPFLATGGPALGSLLPNQVYRNLDGKFEEVIRAGRFGHLQKGHGVGFADFDGDGDQDICLVVGGAYEGDTFVNSLYRNPGTKGHWISLWLEGKTANRSALGAEVLVETRQADGSIRQHHHWVSPGGSFGGNSLRAHIGLGNATLIRKLEVTWPSASRPVDRFANISPDKPYFLVEGDSLRPAPQPAWNWTSTTPSHHHGHTSHD